MAFARPRSGIVPAIGGTGTSSPVPHRRFDFANAPDSENFEELAQANALIGMRSVNGLEYAPQALAEVHYDPVNLLADPNDFLTSNWARNGGIVPVKINARDWVYTETASGSLLQQFAGDWPADSTIHVRQEIPKGDGVSDWIRIVVGDNAGSNQVISWVSPATGAAGSQTGVGSGVPGKHSMEDAGDHWLWRIECSFSTAISQPVVNMSTAASDGAVSSRQPAGTQFMLRYWQVSVADLPFQDNDGVGALGNYILAGASGEILYLELIDGEIWVVHDCTNATGDGICSVAGGASAAVPYTMQAEAFGTGISSLGFSGGGTSTAFTERGTIVHQGTPVGGSSLMQFRTKQGEKTYFRECDYAEGPEVFGIGTSGAARYLMRRKQGIGRLNEPLYTNQLLCNNVAPTDTSGTSPADNVVTHEAVARENLPQAVRDGLDAIDPKGTIRAVFHTVTGDGSGRIFSTATTGTTGQVYHGVWAFPIDAEVGVRLSGGNFNVGALPGSWSRITDTDTSATVNELQTVGGRSTGAEWYWFGAFMVTDYIPAAGEDLSLIPIAGSARVRAADNPVALLPQVGVDTGQNRIPQSSNQGAVAGGAFPDNWLVSDQQGWTASVAEVGPNYIDIRYQASNATGLMVTTPSQLDDVVAATGQTWRGTWDVAVVGGSVSGMKVEITMNERDGTGSFLDGGATEITDLLSATPRAFSMTRAFTNASTARMSIGLNVEGTGAQDVTLRIMTGDQSAPTAQLSAGYPLRPVTTGTAIDFQAWADGLTVLDEWDSSTNVNFDRFWEMGDGSGGNPDRLYAATDAATANAYFQIEAGATITGPVSTSGLALQQQAVEVGNQETRVDGVAVGKITDPLAIVPTQINLGNRPQGDRPRAGVQKRIEFRGRYEAEAVGV